MLKEIEERGDGVQIGVEHVDVARIAVGHAFEKVNGAQRRGFRLDHIPAFEQRGHDGSLRELAQD